MYSCRHWRIETQSFVNAPIKVVGICDTGMINSSIGAHMWPDLFADAANMTRFGREVIEEMGECSGGRIGASYYNESAVSLEVG